MKTFPDLLTFGVSAGISALVNKRVINCLWELTFRCTARCAICPYWKNPSDPKEELSLGQIRKGLEIIHSHGCRVVNFTGGEPTVRRDLEHIVGHASHLGFWTSLVTNGSLLTRQRILDLKAAGLDNLWVSLDSVRPSVHDRQRGLPGLHEKVERCADWISRDFLTGHRTGGVMTVLTNFNVDEIEGLVRYAEELGVYLFVQPYHENKTGSAEFNPGTPTALGDLLVRMKKHHKSVLNSQRFLAEIPRYYQAPSRRPCNAGRKYFSIDPFGQLHPCVDMPSVGHLLRDDISVLQSEEAIRSVRSCRGCWYGFRGESDVSLSSGGVLEKMRMGAGVMLQNYRRNRSRQRTGPV